MKIEEKTLKDLLDNNIIAPPQYEIALKEVQTRPISIHWEIRIMLIAGISLLTSGLGILIYKNIDTIGHQTIVVLIALAIVGCGWYVLKKIQPFSLQMRQKEQSLADNILVLGCSLFLILEGYLQYQYTFFGTRYGLATLIPTLLFFFCAYRFDHIGVLTMAMTAFASWAGITATPLSIFKEDVFQHQPTLIHTGIVVGLILMIVGLLLNFKTIKPHFTFSYLNFGYNLLSIALLSGAFVIDKVFYALTCVVFAVLAIWYARREESPFFLLAGAIYGYIAFTTFITIVNFDFFTWMLYCVTTCFAIVIFFLNFKIILRSKNK